MADEFKSVVQVAREAAEAWLRTNGANQDDMGIVRQELGSAAAIQIERQFLEQIAFHMREGHLRAVAAVGGLQFNARAPAAPATDETWMLSESDQCKAIELLGQIEVQAPDEPDTRPVFTKLARPDGVPPELRTLQTSEPILIQANFCGRASMTASTAGRYIAELEEIVRRQADGFLTLEEAAQWLDDADQGPARTWLNDLEDAAESGGLKMHEPGTRKRINYKGNPKKRIKPRAVHTDWDWAHVEGLNFWLDKENPYVPFRFPLPSPAVAHAAEPPTSTESAPVDAPLGLAASAEGTSETPTGNAAGRLVKRPVLVAELSTEWPSIERDLSEQSRNGLKEAAHAGKHGWYYLENARAWAIENGKSRRVHAPSPQIWPSTLTRRQD